MQIHTSLHIPWSQIKGTYNHCGCEATRCRPQTPSVAQGRERDDVEISPQKIRLIFESLGAHTQQLDIPDLIPRFYPRNSSTLHKVRIYILVDCPQSSPSSLRQSWHTDSNCESSTTLSSLPSPSHYLPRRKSPYRNHGYGKVEEDAAVGTNWYVDRFSATILRIWELHSGLILPGLGLTERGENS
jgi:hypothetical protein